MEKKRKKKEIFAANGAGFGVAAYFCFTGAG